MKKGKLVGKILGIALVVVMLTSTLGGLVWARESDVVGAGYVDVSFGQAKDMIGSDPDVTVLNVITEDEYETAHIAGTELVPLSGLEQRTGELDKDDAQCSSIGDQLEQGCSRANSRTSTTSASSSLLGPEIDAILDSNKPVFLFFYAEWCHFCQEQMPIIDELEQEYAEEIALIRVDSEDDPQAMQEFGVTGFPAMFLIIEKGESGEYVCQEFDGLTDRETLRQSFDYVITNGGLPKGAEDSSIGFQQTESDDFSVVNQEELTMAEFEEELANDSEFKELHDYAKQLGYFYPYKIEKITYSDDSSLIVTVLVSNDSSSLSLFRYCSVGDCYSVLMKIDNEAIAIFDLDGGMKIDMHGSLSTWSAHQSCTLWNYSGCYAGCQVVKGLEGFEEAVIDLGIMIGKCAQCVACAGVCVGGIGACTALFPEGCVLLGPCLTCLPSLGPKPGIPCVDCLGSYFSAVWARFNTLMTCIADCRSDPTLYPYLGRQCCHDPSVGIRCPNRQTEIKKCGNYPVIVAPGTTVHFPNAIFEATCTDCEWLSAPNPIQVCGIHEVCVDTPTPHCKEVDSPDVPPGGDNPDETYDVSTPQITSNNGLDPEITSDIAVLFKGFPISAVNLLASFNESAAFVDVDFSPDLVNDYSTIIIPSGGLYGLDSLPSFKSNLEEYVEKGGTLIAFSQQHGYEYNALPGGEVSGYGWLEDQSCHHGSVGISTYHPILSGQDSVTSDVDVDGYFTKYPDNATVLLSRTKNGMPAMLMYEYGEGRVIATTAYTDWAYGRGQATQDGIHLVRDMIAWVKGAEEIPEYGASDTVDIPVGVFNVHLPIPEVEYPQYAPGDVVSIPIEITNYSDNQTSDGVVFSVFDPDYEMEDIAVSVTILPGETTTVDFTYETTGSSKTGVYFVLYSLYAGETLIGGGFGSGFGVGVDTSELSTYRVNFRLRDPDKNIIQEQTATLTVPAGGNETAGFAYVNPSKLGIWSLEYEILDYNDMLLESGVQKFAVGKYAENPDGWVYQGEDIAFAVSSPEERYAYGSDVPFTIHVWNNGDTDRSVSFSTYYKDWSLSTKLSEQNVDGTLDVPAGGEASFTHTLHIGDVYLSHNQLIIYATFSEDGGNLGRTEKVIWMFSPSIDVSVSTDKQEYVKGEDVSLQLNLENKRSATYDVSAIVRVLDAENNKVFEESFNVTLSGDTSHEENLGFSLSTTYGVYVVSAEAYVEGQKVGSGSTYFEVCKDYMVRVAFDHPDKIYRARESMEIDLEAINAGAVPWSSIVDISVPVLGFSDSVDFALDPGQSEQVSYDLSIPEDIAAGKHAAILAIGFDGSVEQRYFFIPQSELVLNIDKTSYDAGENLSIDLSNIGGVDTTGECSIRFYDSHGFMIYEGESQGSIQAEGNRALEFMIPEQAVGGDYYLLASCRDLSTDKVTRLSKSCTVEGLEASVTSATDKKTYFTDEDIFISTNITNLDGALNNTMLALTIYSGRYQIAPDVITEDLGDRLRIWNTFVEAVMETSEWNTGTFTIGTTGGDPAITTDDYVKLMYGHPYPGTSFTTVRIDGSDYTYGSSEGAFVEVPHFDGTSIVSSWEVEDVVVTQRLTIVYSSTGNPDAVQVKYSIRNESDLARDVGVRIMIDTQLAENDGAPFTIPGIGDITNEMEFNGAEVPVWWTTMDSLTSPNVIAHGTLRGVGSDPDKFVIARWPGIQGTLWDYQIDPSRYITSDSAIGMWWYPTSLLAGESKDVATFYGIGYVSEVGGVVIWEDEIPLGNLAEGQEASIPTEISLDATGKLLLVARLNSETSQVIAQDTAYFYITDQDTYLTLETEEAIYKPGEEVVISGEVTNGSAEAKNYDLSITVNGEEIYSEGFGLDAGQSHVFTTTTVQDNSFILEGTVNGVIVTDFIMIEYPSANVDILAPDVVGLADFDVGILVENVASVDCDISVTLVDEAWDVLIPAGESRLMETTMSITEDTTLSVIISGDVDKTVQKDIIMGEDARIEIAPQNIYLEGTVEIPFTVENTGVLDTEFEVTFSISSPEEQTIVRTLFIPLDESIAGTLSFELTQGLHLLQYSSPFEEGAVEVRVGVPEFVVTELPSNLNLTCGQEVTWTFKVGNIGGAEGEAHLYLMLPDWEETNFTWVRPGQEEEIAFSFIVPDDLEEKEYKAIYELDGVRDEFTFFVHGAKVSVNAALDKALYEEGETAILTLTVTNECDFDLSLYARVKLDEYEEVRPFDLVDSETLVFNVPVTFNGNKLFYGIYMESGRALYLNALYIHQRQIITLYTDKQVYLTGETATIFVETTESGTLSITAPGYSTELELDGSTTLKFTIPELRSGTYYIEYTFDGFSSSYPFDVIGYSARIIEFGLDKESYSPGELILMEANVQVNRDVTGLLRVRIYGPEHDALDEFDIPVTLAQGENAIKAERIFLSDRPGIHSLVYQLFGDLAGHSLVLLSSGAEYFDGISSNTPPVADAGPDQTVCAVPPATTAMVTLDGSGSYDADGDPLTYTWTWDGNTACGVNPTVELPLGTTTITLVVNDGKADSEPDTVDITVWIRATIDFDPDTLNLKAKGKYVTVYIELPPGYDVSQIDIFSIRLNGTVPALAKPTQVGDYDSDGVPDLMVKFDASAVKGLLTPGSQVEITITGEVAGIAFEGSDTIRVISK